MKIVCSGCGAQHWLSDMQVSHGGCSVSCPNCSTQVFVDASNIDPQSLEPRWYYAVNDDSVGPLSTQDLEFSFQNGQVTLDSFVWCEGMSDWMALGSVPELDYLKSALSGTPAAGEDEATRVAGVGGYAGFSPMGAAMGDAGEETAAIDINELEKQSAGGYSPFDNASGGIVGMDGNAAVDEEPEFNMNSAMPSANDMMGARSENSVLFSLSSLQGMSAVPVETPSGVPSSPNAGLVDVKALAASAPVARRRNNEPVNSFGSAAAMPMATVLPLGNKKDNTPLFIIGGVVGVVLIALIVIIALLVGGVVAQRGELFGGVSPYFHALALLLGEVFHQPVGDVDKHRHQHQRHADECHFPDAARVVEIAQIHKSSLMIVFHLQSYNIIFNWQALDSGYLSLAGTCPRPCLGVLDTGARIVGAKKRGHGMASRSPVCSRCRQQRV